MRKLFTVIMVAVASASPAQQSDPAPRVSLIQILARPADFDGKRVRVIGYATVGTEDTALFLGPSDFENIIFENSVFLNFGTPESPLTNNQYAQIEGVFHIKSEKNHVRQSVGVIDSITYVRPWLMDEKSKALRPLGCW